MTTIFIPLPDKYWIEWDVELAEIIAVHYKPQIKLDIASIEASLLLYPDPTQDAKDVTAVLNLIAATDWLPARKTRVSGLVNTMYQCYQGDPKVLEAAALPAKLEALQILLAKLV